MPEIRIAKQETLLDVKSTAEAINGKFGELSARQDGFPFQHQIPYSARDGMGWQVLAVPPDNFQNASAAAFGNDIYVFGNSGTASSVIRKYSVVTGLWTNVNPSPLPSATLHKSIAVVIGSDIYVIFGLDTRKLAKYTPANNSWTELADAPNTLTGAAAGTVNSYLYVAGGAGASETAFRRYAPGADTWTDYNALPYQAASAMGGVVNGVLYVYSVTANRMIMWNQNFDTWTQQTDPPVALGRGAHAVFGNKLIFAGGTSAFDTTKRVWFYDPVADTWERTADAHYTFYSGVGAAISGAFYALGGSAPTFHKMASLFSLLGKQSHGEVKQGQKVYYHIRGVDGGVMVDDAPIASGGTVAQDGLLSTNIQAGFGVIRGWVN